MFGIAVSPASAPAALDALTQALFAALTAARPPADRGVEGLNGPQAAAFIGVKPSTWYALYSGKHIPSPMSLGGEGKCPRWSATELRCWLLSGAPPRDAWEHIREERLQAFAPRI